MSYVNAEDVLPKTLIEEIQKHVDGQLIYIPRKHERSLSWGEKTAQEKNWQNVIKRSSATTIQGRLSQS